MKRFTQLVFLACLVCFSTTGLAQKLAFPGAEGGGRYTVGGRGGNVYSVTSLDDTNTGNSTTNEGTLRWCLGQPGPRTIVFKVGGIIQLTSNLTVPSFTTIAGQTAPGDGILIRNAPITVPASCLTAETDISTNCPSFVLNGSNIIIRYIRIRPGDDIDNTVGAPLSNIKFETDAIFGRDGSNIIIDHCSFGWGIDETASFYDNTNFTMQWCLAAESLRASFHPKGVHGYGGIWGGKTASFHHNLLAHHDSRNPRMCGSRYSNQPDKELVDFRNNVIYNWGGNSGYAGEGGSYNFVNNYYSYGLATGTKDRIFSPNGDDGANNQLAGVWGSFYLNGNYTYGYASTTSNNWDGLDPAPTSAVPLPGGSVENIKSYTVFNSPAVTTHTAEDAYSKVLSNVGACLVRDAIDTRVINEVTNRLAPVRETKIVAAGGSVKAGLIDTPSDAGGYPTYLSGTAPTDTDHDGMPDAWETANGLNPNDPSDRNLVATSGYTMLEQYVNSLVASITASGLDGGVVMGDVGSSAGTSAVTLAKSTCTANTMLVYSFTDGYTISNTVGKTYGTGSEDGIKYSSSVQYTVNLPSGVKVVGVEVSGYDNYPDGDSYISELGGTSFASTAYVFPKKVGTTYYLTTHTIVLDSPFTNSFTFTVKGYQVVLSIKLTVAPNTPTGIKTPVAATKNPYDRVCVYGIDGRVVRYNVVRKDATLDLPRGVYIVDGEKIGVFK